MDTIAEDRIQVRIFQMPSEERSRAWISVQELREAGMMPDASRYRMVMSTEMGKEETMADLYDRYHYGSPGGMDRLQVGDVLMFGRGDDVQSYYVDPFGFKEVPELTRPLIEHNRSQMQQQTHRRTGR